MHEWNIILLMYECRQYAAKQLFKICHRDVEFEAETVDEERNSLAAQNSCACADELDAPGLGQGFLTGHLTRMGHTDAPSCPHGRTH
ncbi:hypothetical protein ACLKA6_001032 [Drosophila palustris]